MLALCFLPLIDKVKLLQQNGSEDLVPSSSEHSSDAHNRLGIWHMLRKVNMLTNLDNIYYLELAVPEGSACKIRLNYRDGSIHVF
jgi:hypothetical protein